MKKFTGLVTVHIPCNRYNYKYSIKLLTAIYKQIELSVHF